MKLLTLFFCLLFSTLSFSNFTHKTEVTFKKMSLERLDRKHSFLKDQAQKKIDRFLIKYVENHKNKNVPQFTLKQIIQLLKFNDNTNPITLFEAVEVVNKFTSFVWHDSLITIVLDDKDVKLYENMLLYSIGLLNQLDRLQNYNIQNSHKVEVLKKKVLKFIQPFVTSEVRGKYLKTFWMSAYFHLYYAIHTNYPMDVLNNLAGDLIIIIRNSKDEHEKRAAGAMLLELTMYSSTYGTKPFGEVRQPHSGDRDYYLERIFKMCESDCSASGRSLKHSGFETKYLSLLKRVNKKQYEKYREKLIFKEFSNSYKGLRQRRLKDYWHLILISIGYILEYIPVYASFLGISIILLIFWGHRRYLWIKPRAWELSSSGYKRCFQRALWFSLYLIFAIYNVLLQPIYLFFFNFKEAILDPRDKLSSLGASSFIVFITMLINEARKYLDSFFS